MLTSCYSESKVCENYIMLVLVWLASPHVEPRDCFTRLKYKQSLARLNDISELINSWDYDVFAPLVVGWNRKTLAWCKVLYDGREGSATNTDREHAMTYEQSWSACLRMWSNEWRGREDQLPHDSCTSIHIAPVIPLVGSSVVSWLFLTSSGKVMKQSIVYFL